MDLARLAADLDDPVVLDADALAFLDNYAAEVRATRAGHWHPGCVDCSERCPMGDPRTAARFRAELDRAQAGFPRRPLPGGTAR